jgi:SSS family solute:Na+ symporter
MPESKTTVNSSCRCGKRAVTIATGLVIKGLAVALLCPPMARDVVAQLIGTRLDAEERQMLIQELREALNSQSGWPRVHAAEALIAEGLSDETLPVFRPLVESAPPPERIGVWRVLAQAETSAEARRRMVERVRAAFRDVNGPDRLHAVETLAKLRVRVSGEDQAAVERFASGPAGEAAFANWLLAIGGNADARQALVDALRHPEPLARQRAAYSLSRLEGHAPLPSARHLRKQRGPNRSTRLRE